MTKKELAKEFRDVENIVGHLIKAKAKLESGRLDYSVNKYPSEDIIKMIKLEINSACGLLNELLIMLKEIRKKVDM